MPADLQYHLWLQDFRNATGGTFNEFFNAVSRIAVDIIFFLFVSCIPDTQQKRGYRFMLPHMCGELINGKEI